MSYLFDSMRFQYNADLFKILQFEKNLRKRLYVFEYTPLKNQEKTENFMNEILIKALNDVKDYEKNIKGFNLWGFLLGVSVFHTGRLYMTKKLLYEFEHRAINHIIYSIAFGCLSGYILGNKIAYDFKLYRTYRKTLKNIEHIQEQFDFYYIHRNEEEVED